MVVYAYRLLGYDAMMSEIGFITSIEICYLKRRGLKISLDGSLGPLDIAELEVIRDIPQDPSINKPLFLITGKRFHKTPLNGVSMSFVLTDGVDYWRYAAPAVGKYARLYARLCADVHYQFSEQDKNKVRRAISNFVCGF